MGPPSDYDGGSKSPSHPGSSSYYPRSARSNLKPFSRPNSTLGDMGSSHDGDKDRHDGNKDKDEYDGDDIKYGDDDDGEH
jgi:hypothetical protein